MIHYCESLFKKDCRVLVNFPQLYPPKRLKYPTLISQPWLCQLHFLGYPPRNRIKSWEFVWLVGFCHQHKKREKKGRVKLGTPHTDACTWQDTVTIKHRWTPNFFPSPTSARAGGGTLVATVISTFFFCPPRAHGPWNLDGNGLFNYCHLPVSNER
jgi:hypothetical protein